MSIAPVVRAITIDTRAERAFAVFTERIGDWWPLATHTATEVLAADLAFVGGALVETSPDGEPSVWGTVTEWDPPNRLALTWSPTGGPETSIEVDFEASGGQTRIVLTHAGWEAYGDRAAAFRDGYEGEYAWGWILDLFSHAVGAPGSAGVADKPAYDIAPLRSGYESVALALEVAEFGDPEPGEWNARQVAGHVTTNAVLMSRVIDDVRAGRVARLNGPEDHAESAIGRFDGAEYDAVAGGLRRTSADLIARCAGLTAGELAAPVSTFIQHHGKTIVDGEMTVGELLAAQVHFHLPAHVSQLEDLTALVLRD
jgi:uncharacterized protein YndB with AHSA1/START domain